MSPYRGCSDFQCYTISPLINAYHNLRILCLQLYHKFQIHQPGFLCLFKVGSKQVVKSKIVQSHAQLNTLVNIIYMHKQSTNQSCWKQSRPRKSEFVLASSGSLGDGECYLMQELKAVRWLHYPYSRYSGSSKVTCTVLQIFLLYYG